MNRTNTGRCRTPALAAAALAAALMLPTSGAGGAAPDTDTETLAEQVASEAENEQALMDDLEMALTLQGVDCGEVVEMERSGENGYDVQCQRGGIFRLIPDANVGLRVFNLIEDVARAGVSGAKRLLAVPRKVISLGAESVADSAEIGHHLLAMLRIAGRNCDEVADVETRADDDHVVHCRDGGTHHVYTDSDGLIVIEEMADSGTAPAP